MPFVQRINGRVVGQFANLQPGIAEEWLADGSADLLPLLPDFTERVCAKIDAAADAARRKVIGDPLRALEYSRAAAEALEFAAAGYQGAAPPMVAAWAVSGRSAEQAAADILIQSSRCDQALLELRRLRLSAKELARAAVLAGDLDGADRIAIEALATIASVAEAFKQEA